MSAWKFDKNQNLVTLTGLFLFQCFLEIKVSSSRCLFQWIDNTVNSCSKEWKKIQTCSNSVQMNRIMSTNNCSWLCCKSNLHISHVVCIYYCASGLIKYHLCKWNNCLRRTKPSHKHLLITTLFNLNCFPVLPVTATQLDTCMYRYQQFILGVFFFYTTMQVLGFCLLWKLSVILV